MTARYRWDPEDYAQHSSVQLDWARELIAKLRLSDTEAVLDIGCGDGRVTALLAQKTQAGAVVGIDSSAEMIAAARTRFPAAAFPNLSFQLMDATRLEFEEAFDIAFSNAALHWIQDHPAVLRGVGRALRPGGRLLFQMGGRGNAAEVIASIEGLFSTARWKPFFKDFTFPYWFYGPDDYRNWLPKAGLHPTRVELIPKTMQHRSRSGLAGWIRTAWLPYTQQVPPDRRDEFIDDLLESYFRMRLLDEHEVAQVQMVRLEVEAKKPGTDHNDTVGRVRRDRS